MMIWNINSYYKLMNMYRAQEKSLQVNHFLRWEDGRCGVIWDYKPN